MRERWRLEREAVLDSRPAKPHGVSLNQLHGEWRERLQDLGYEPGQLIRRVLGRVRSLDGIDRFEMVRLGETALRVLGDGQSSWRPAELLRELAAAVPTTTGAAAADLTEVLDRLAVETTRRRCVDVSRPRVSALQEMVNNLGPTT